MQAGEAGTQMGQEAAGDARCPSAASPCQGTNMKVTSRTCGMQMKKSAFLLFLISCDYKRNIEISSKRLFASGVVNFPRNSVNTSKSK